MIFLIGALILEANPVEACGTARSAAEMAPLRVEMLLARDPAAEPGLLREGARILGSAEQWVSFNGRCFDHPRFRKRAARHRIEPPECVHHLDLLLEVRRRWKGKLPDCRLGTVERRLLGLERGPGDIPGREVPERYRDYVATGERRWLDPVIEHNRRDVIAMAALLGKLVALDESLLRVD